MPVLDPDDDAFGAALADHAAYRPGPELVLEVDDGYRTPALPASAFFLPESSWSPTERQVLGHAPPGGPVLDLGAAPAGTPCGSSPWAMRSPPSTYRPARSRSAAPAA